MTEASGGVYHRWARHLATVPRYWPRLNGMDRLGSVPLTARRCNPNHASRGPSSECGGRELGPFECAYRYACRVEPITALRRRPDRILAAPVGCAWARARCRCRLSGSGWGAGADATGARADTSWATWIGPAFNGLLIDDSKDGTTVTGGRAGTWPSKTWDRKDLWAGAGAARFPSFRDSYGGSGGGGGRAALAA